MTPDPMNPPDAAAEPKVGLCLGGFDPSGGAGILRDAEVLWELGVLPMAISLAETLQNGITCLRVLRPVLPPLEHLRLLEPHLAPGTWAVKLGLCALSPGELTETIRFLASRGPVAAIWDPVLGPSRGEAVHEGEDLLRLAELLFAEGSWVASPNLQEARRMAEADGRLGRDADTLARPFLERGAAAVWLKGGHGEAPDTVEDFWITPEGVHSLGRHPRLPGERRGTGCTLASTWIGLILQGAEPRPAAEAAARRLRARWPSAAAPGGQGRACFLPEPPC